MYYILKTNKYTIKILDRYDDIKEKSEFINNKVVDSLFETLEEVNEKLENDIWLQFKNTENYYVQSICDIMGQGNVKHTRYSYIDADIVIIVELHTYEPLTSYDFDVIIKQYRALINNEYNGFLYGDGDYYIDRLIKDIIIGYCVFPDSETYGGISDDLYTCIIFYNKDVDDNNMEHIINRRFNECIYETIDDWRE